MRGPVMRGLGLFAAASGAALLAGCASAPTRFHVLEASAPAAPAPYAAAYAGAAVRVEVVHLPPVLDRLELVSSVGANAVKVRDLDHWAAPLGEMARRALTQDLVARLPRGAVVFPDSPRPPGARGLAVDVLSFTQGQGSQGSGEATMDAAWTLLAGARGDPLRQRTVRLSAPGTDGPDGQAAAIGTLLGRLADAIAADLAASPPPAVAGDQGTPLRR